MMEVTQERIDFEHNKTDAIEVFSKRSLALCVCVFGNPALNMSVKVIVQFVHVCLLCGRVDPAFHTVHSGI